MTLKQTIDTITSRLSPRYGDGEARQMARIIFEHLKGYTPVDIAVNPDRTVSDFIAGKVDAIVDRLLNGEPLQYIIGETYWHGLTLKVTPAVLIPRPETAELVDIIADAEGDKTDLRVLDCCTGSGCIAVALARSLRFARVTGVDISNNALEVARANDRELKTGVDFEQADVTKDKIDGEFDIVVSNPPYVLESEKKDMDANVLDHEPAIALFVPDSDPLRFYKAVERQAMRCLVPGGRIYFEINPLTADSLKEYMTSNDWQNVSVLPDIHGRRRFLSAVKPS